MDSLAQKAFSLMKIAKSTPYILMFKTFQELWAEIDQSKLQAAADAAENPEKLY